jgi:hypothetical protein
VPYNMVRLGQAVLPRVFGGDYDGCAPPETDALPRMSAETAKSPSICVECQVLLAAIVRRCVIVSRCGS